ncbi:MAG: patatin-like phospholipase family protein [Gammaproteobacteria bacterium]
MPRNSSIPVDECDLVMKGGIASGIAYPSFVLKLKDRYRFRSVGGTSVGAIAAAATAAAEYGRNTGGFDKLCALRDQLSKGTFLRDLFQPSQSTRPLFGFLLDFMQLVKGKEGAWSKVTLAVRLLPHHFPIVSGLGSLLGVGAALAVTWLVSGSSPLGVFVLTVILAIAGAILLTAVRIWRILTRTVPKNAFGICTGRRDGPDAGEEDPTVLTDWLNQRLNDLAGLTPAQQPLTFGRLKHHGNNGDAAAAGASGHKVELRMVTSNLSQNQPYTLPFVNHPFIFKAEEFYHFFPKSVVDYMAADAALDSNDVHQKKRLTYRLPPGYYFLPEADDLPVIVATRMSLSFPVLLSAVPLYTIRPEKAVVKDTGQPVPIGEADLQKNWFSDGGIASNFPIHFFDAWLPRHPTFGVNLVSLPDEQIAGTQSIKEGAMSVANDPLSDPAGRARLSSDAVYLPRADDLIATEWVAFEGRSGSGGPGAPSLGKFFWAIFNTAQNYRDNTQAMLPSYRERIVQIRLAENEGGLNLAMPIHTINQVIAKGEQAGEVVNGQFDFDIHRWVRFQVMMKQMEAGLDRLERVLSDYDFYLELLHNPPLPPKYPYPRDDPWFEDAARRIKDLGGVIREWKKMKPPLLFQTDAPTPEPVLRVMPEI